MLIIQGSNSPIYLDLGEISGIITDAEGVLSDKRNEIVFSWDFSKIEIDNNKVKLLFNQEDTINIESGRYVFEFKWYINGNVILAETLAALVEKRASKTLLGTDQPGNSVNNPIKIKAITNVIQEIGEGGIVNSVNGYSLRDVWLNAKDINMSDEKNTIENSILNAYLELSKKQNTLIPGGDNVHIEDDIISVDPQPPGTTVHNATSNRDANDCHPITSISELEPKLQQLENGYNSIDDKLDSETAILHQDILNAYTNSVSYPVMDHEYNSNNTWITFNENIYKANKNTIWTGVINGDWDAVFWKIPEVVAYVDQKIKEFEEQEFPLQMRPDANFGVYQKKSEFPLTDNQPGYLCIASNDGENSGIYIWGIDYKNPTQFMWQPFVVVAPITQDTLNVTFNGTTESLKLSMASIQEYIDSELSAETYARLNQYNGLNERTTLLENKALTVDSEINATVFRGTQEQFDVDPAKDNYFLALIITEE